MAGTSERRGEEDERRFWRMRGRGLRRREEEGIERIQLCPNVKEGRDGAREDGRVGFEPKLTQSKTNFD